MNSGKGSNSFVKVKLALQRGSVKLESTGQSDGVHGIMFAPVSDSVEIIDLLLRRGYNPNGLVHPLL